MDTIAGTNAHTPTSPTNAEDSEYVGFWPRVGATFIDILAPLAITAQLTCAVYGRYGNPGHYMGPADLLINPVMPTIIVIALWARFGAAPGKMVMSARIVDADTGEPLAVGKLIIW